MKPNGFSARRRQSRCTPRTASAALYPTFFAARSYASLADLNRQLDTWIDRVVHQRRVPGESEKLVVQALAEEEPRLLKLPEHPFQTESIRVTSSGKTPYLRHRGRQLPGPRS
ncbi:MAG: hypothetical protein WDO69_23905 [Pseudomonadota bacterium]